MPQTKTWERVFTKFTTNCSKAVQSRMRTLNVKFYYYIYGRQVALITDHKSLVSTFRKQITHISVTLHGMRLKLVMT